MCLQGRTAVRPYRTMVVRPYRTMVVRTEGRTAVRPYAVRPYFLPTYMP